MVRAIIEGRKTQTRRVMKPQPELHGSFYEWAGAGWSNRMREVRPVPGHSLSARCPCGAPGDRLWVRETWARCTKYGGHFIYRADDEIGTCHVDGDRWKAAIHMPRAACRLLLEVTDVRVQRLQDISDDDAIAEGINRIVIGSGYHDRFAAQPTTWNEVVEGTSVVHDEPRDAFQDLWDSINAKRAPWASNPWVWAITFKRISP